MLKIGPKYIKLKTSLQIAVTRLKYLQSHKSELSERIKLEIIKCIQNGKYMQARIKAQSFLRNKATVETLELVEMYCEQLLERYDLFQQMKKPDESLIGPVSNLIWVTPYYQTQVGELKVVMKQLAAKYGNNFCRMALSNREGNVSPELIERVKLFVFTDEKIEKCLKNICRKFNIDYRENKRRSTRKKPDNDFDSPGEIKEENTLQENSEYQASGIHSIEESISSKKAFMAIMSKLKNKKKSKKKSSKSKQASRSDVLSSSTMDGSIHKSRSSKDEGKETEEKLNDSDVDNENKSNSMTSEAEKNSCEYSKSEFSNDPKGVSYSMTSSVLVSNFSQMYPEPPPPYNYQYADDISNDLPDEVKAESSTLEESRENQASGIPSIEESVSSKKAFVAIIKKNNKLKHKKKYKKNRSSKSKQASRSDVLSNSTMDGSIHQSRFSKDKGKEIEEKLNDSDVNNENNSSSMTSEAEKNSSECSKCEFSNDPKGVSYSMAPPVLVSNFTPMYPEPPPPYNYQYADGISNDLERSFQFPSCPELSDVAPERLSSVTSLEELKFKSIASKKD